MGDPVYNLEFKLVLFNWIIQLSARCFNQEGKDFHVFLDAYPKDDYNMNTLRHDKNYSIAQDSKMCVLFGLEGKEVVTHANVLTVIDRMLFMGLEMKDKINTYLNKTNRKYTREEMLKFAEEIQIKLSPELDGTDPESYLRDFEKTLNNS